MTAPCKALSLAAHRPHAPVTEHQLTHRESIPQLQPGAPGSSYTAGDLQEPRVCAKELQGVDVCVCVMPCNATSLYIYLHNSENLKDVPVLGGRKKKFVVKTSEWKLSLSLLLIQTLNWGLPAAVR